MKSLDRLDFARWRLRASAFAAFVGGMGTALVPGSGFLALLHGQKAGWLALGGAFALLSLSGLVELASSALYRRARQ